MKKIATDFGLYAVEWGDLKAPPVILLHAFPLSHAMWEAQFPALSPRYRAVAYDVRGLGGSELGDGQFTMEEFVDDLIRLLDTLEISRAVLCGISMGGYIALRAMEKFPQRISALVLAGTRSEADDNTGKLKRAQSIEVLKNKGLAALADPFVASLLGQTGRRQNPQLQKKLLDLINSQSRRGVVAAQLAMLSRTDTTESLARISVPTLVIHGEEDEMIPIAQARAMHARIPGARLVAIPEAGHLSNMQQPEIFNKALLEFLGGL